MGFKVRIMFVWWRNGIYGNTGAVWRHVGDLLKFINSKPMSSEFSKGGLWKENRYVAIVMVLPCKGSAKEPIDWAHEVNHGTFLKFFLEAGFLITIGGVINKVINVNANMYRRSVRVVLRGRRWSNYAREQQGSCLEAVSPISRRAVANMLNQWCGDRRSP